MSHVEGGGVPAGTQLNGIYEIEKRLAMGGMGEVYVGKLIQTGDKVAIKMILPEHANNELILDLFRREASTLHNLYHPAIVRYYVFSVDPVLNRPYLTMEFAGGPALGDRLKDGGPLNEQEMSVMRRRVAGGLHAAHELGIVHRDMSPDNIILVDGDVEKTKIIDFGIAKSTSQEGTLIGSGFAGKLNYVSPEQLGLGDGEVTGKSDIYSLGLVFAEAVIGRPLPMGGSQVEVIEKRRSVPDLSEVPIWIRPLIESMIQPDPADRPADMDAVANWTNDGGAAAVPAAAPSRPVHPRDRRKSEAQRSGGDKKGLPWLWIGLGGGAVAAAAVAGVVIIGGGDPDPGGKIGIKPVDGGGGGLVQGSGAAGTLAAASPSITAPQGEVGATYRWASDAFSYGGSLSDLEIDIDGVLPSGLSLETSSNGRAQINGTPTRAGDNNFTIVVRSPEGDEVRQSVQLLIKKAPQIAVVTPTIDPTTTNPTTTDPTTSNPSTTDPSTASPATGSTDPTVPVLGGQPTLTIPSTGGGTPTIAPGSDGGAPSTGGGVPVLGGGDVPVLGGAPMQPGNPGSGSSDPAPPSLLPGGITPPSGDGGTPVLGGGGGGDTPLVIPSTGGQPQAPSGGGDGTQIAVIPSQENQPPTIQDTFPGTLSAGQGDDVNARLGSFFDEEGPGGMTLKVDGGLPTGLAVRLTDTGVVQLYGTPSEFGDFSFKVAAVDPQGLLSRPIDVALNVKQPTANGAVRDYILGYNGGGCFLSRPVNLGPKLAEIEVFAAEIPPVITFDSDFKRDQAFEANIGLRLVTQDQCALVNALDQVGPQALDNSLHIRLNKDELASGDTLSGTIQGGAEAKLFLFDNLGGMTDLSSFLKPGNGDATFAVPNFRADGSQILVAAKPRAGGQIANDAGLELFLGAAQRGEASLALGFFTIKR